MGSSFQIASDPFFSNYAENSKSIVNVGSLKNGGYVFVWRTQSFIYASVYYSNGTAEPSFFCKRIYSAPPNTLVIERPNILGLGNGNFVVMVLIWINPMSYTSSTVFSFTQNGIVSRNEIISLLVNSVDLMAQRSFNGFVFVYDNYTSLYGQFFDFNGNQIRSGWEFYKSLNGNSLIIPFLVRLNDNCLILVFETGGDYDIHAVKLDPIGNVLSPAFKINSMVLTRYQFYMGATLPNGNFLIVWNNYTIPTMNIIGRIFSPGTNPFRVISNNITIIQGQTLQIDDSMILSISDETIYYQIISLRNGYFSIANVSVSEFTQNDIYNLLVFFTHDGSVFPPSYSLQCKSSGSTLISFADVTFVLAPYFKNNYIEIEQNSKILITNLQIDAVSFDGSPIGYKVISNISCFFEINSNLGVSIIEFTSNQINNLEIYFITFENPSYVLSINSSFGAIKSISNINSNISLRIKTNQMLIRQGESLMIDSSNLEYESNNSLPVSYFVSYVQNGFFAFATRLNEKIFSFTEVDIKNSNLYFIHDGSYKPPMIHISISNGKVISSSDNTQITFDSNMILLNNSLKIRKGESIMISSNFLGAISIQGTNIVFVITDCLHGQFLVENVPSTQFTQQNVLNFLVFFSHDNSESSPSYKVLIGDGTQFSDPCEAIISFNGLPPQPILLKNTFILNQNQSLTLTNDNLLASDGGINSNFTFTMINVYNCYFTLKDNAENPINTFNSDDINNSKIILVANGSINKPEFIIITSTLNGTNNKNEANVIFNIEPTLLTNKLIIKSGEKKIINVDNLQATDKETEDNNILFIVTNVLNGMFALKGETSSNHPITNFYQSQISNAQVLFIHDGTKNPPSYDVSVYDGNIKTAPKQANIEFLLMKGICGMVKTSNIEGYLMESIALTFDNNYIIGSFYNGIIMSININDPENAAIANSLDLSQFNIKNIGSLIIKNNYAYVLSEKNGLITIAIDDLKLLRFVLSTGNTSSGYDLTICENNHIFIGTDIGVSVISLENQENPRIVSFFSVNGSSVPLLTCFNDYLYVVTNNEKSIMNIFDVFNATNPQLKSRVNLSSDANAIKINSKGKLGFVATNVGVDIFDISNPYKIVHLTSIPLSNQPVSLDLSDDDEYLMVLCDMIVIAINIQFIDVYTILDSLTYKCGLNQLLFLSKSNHGFIASSEGFQIFNIFNALQARLSPKLSSISSNYLNGTSNMNSEVSADGNYYFIITLISGWEFLVIKDAKNINSYNTTLNEINLNCRNMNFSRILVSKNDPKTIFVTNCGNLTTISVTNGQIAHIKRSIFLDGAWGLAFSPTEDLIYVTNYKTNQIHIVSNTENLTTIKNITLKQIPKMVYPSSDNQTLYVNLENSGLAIISLNSSIPFIRYETNFDIESMVYFENIYGNPFIIGTFYKNGMIQIIDLKNSSNPIAISQCFIGKETAGIGLLTNKNFIVVQSSNRLTVVEIRDLTYPVIVDGYLSNSIGYTDQMGIIDTILFMPTFEIISIYSGNTFYFPYFSVLNTQTEKLFNVQLFPVDPFTLDKSQEKLRVFAIELEDEVWPFWITINYKSTILTLSPPSDESLSKIRKLKITFGTEISKEEFQNISHDVDNQTIINELRYQHYIDSNNVLTSDYDPNVLINIENGIFSKTVQQAIGDLLKKHLMILIISFTFTDFIELDNAPISGKLTLQAQWDSYPPPKINDRIDFQINQDAFYDPDDDILTYSITGLPSFLQFSNSITLKLYGTPSKNDLGTYSITLIASDGYKNVSQNLIISIINHPPSFIHPGNQLLILGDHLDWVLPANTFFDLDGDELSYSLRMINEIGQEETNAPNWLNLDSSRLRLSGKPDKSDVQIEKENKRFYQIFTLRLKAADIAGQIASFDFNLTVVNYFPIYNWNFTLSNQLHDYYGSYIKVNRYFSFQVSSFTFIDPENAPLSLSVSYLPDWLLFINQRFYGTPTKGDLGDYIINVTASDGYSNTTGNFTISVQNHPPTANNILNFTLLFGHSLNLSISSTNFGDPDDDPLTFQSFMIENNELNQLPFWINFDKETLTFTGLPTEDFIPFIPSEKKYFKVYEISLYAFDICNANVSTNFILTIEKTAPKPNPANSLAAQFSTLNPTVNVNVIITFSDKTFLSDDDSDVLTYEARLLSDSDNGLNFFRRLS